MKQNILLMTAAFASVSLFAPAVAAEPAAASPKAAKTAEAKKPTLTFYYFPG
jgi:hypothetical protein